jgi:integrase/recombinase XerC
MSRPAAVIHGQSMEIIEAYLDSLRQQRRSPYTMRSRRSILRRLDADLPNGLTDTTTGELTGWLDRDDLAHNSVVTYTSAVRDFYDWACRPKDPWLDFNPTLDIDPLKFIPGVARPCTDDELATILGSPVPEIRRWAILGSYQGLRCVEISRLDREHITEQQLVVVQGKGGRPRVHDTDPDVWEAVKDLPDGPVAQRLCRGGRATASYICVWASAHFQDELGLDGVTMHRLRHWLGVNMQRRYKNIRVTQKALGHKSLSSTQIYTDADDSEVRAARATLPRFAA